MATMGLAITGITMAISLTAMVVMVEAMVEAMVEVGIMVGEMAVVVAGMAGVSITDGAVVIATGDSLIFGVIFLRNLRVN
jgi:hypothetical protein